MFKKKWHLKKIKIILFRYPLESALIYFLWGLHTTELHIPLGNKKQTHWDNY